VGSLLPILLSSAATAIAAWIWATATMHRVRESSYHEGFERGYAAGKRDGRLEERAVRPCVQPHRSGLQEE